MWWESVKDWTIPLIAKRIHEIASMGWIKVSDWHEWKKKDDGQIGQAIERLFAVPENNDELPDLGKFEIKTLRTTSSMYTLKHRSTHYKGMNSREIFAKYSYPKEDEPKYSKLYSAFGYRDFNEPLLCDEKCIGKEGKCGHYFSLRSQLPGEIEIHHRKDGYLSTLDLKDVWSKIDNVLFISVDARHGTGKMEEEFKINSALILDSINSPDSLLKEGVLRCEFSMSQSKKYYPNPKDRGHHFRMSVPKKLTAKVERFNRVWSNCVEIFPHFREDSLTFDVENNQEDDDMGGGFDDKIVQGDVLTELRKIPSKTFNFAFTSPPYNLKNSTGNGMKDGRGGKWANAKLIEGYTDHHDQMAHEEYVAWQRKVITEVMRTLKDDGAFFYNHKWRVQGGLIQDRSDIVEGFPVRQIIIWQRSGGINFNKGYFLPTYEVIYVIAKKNFKLEKGANKLGDVWKINQDIKNPHPASFPIGLAMNVIKSCPGDLVLDPFMGSGTTAAAAKLCGKNYFGIELSKEYIELAEKRLEHVSKFGEDLNWRKKNKSGQRTLF